jgi:hypothetical protein
MALLQQIFNIKMTKILNNYHLNSSVISLNEPPTDLSVDFKELIGPSTSSRETGLGFSTSEPPRDKRLVNQKTTIIRVKETAKTRAVFLLCVSDFSCKFVSHLNINNIQTLNSKIEALNSKLNS